MSYARRILPDRLLSENGENFAHITFFIPVSAAPDPARGAQLHLASLAAETAFPGRSRSLPAPLRPHQQPAAQDPPGRGPARAREAEE